MFCCCNDSAFTGSGISLLSGDTSRAQTLSVREITSEQLKLEINEGRTAPAQGKGDSGYHAPHRPCPSTQGAAPRLRRTPDGSTSALRGETPRAPTPQGRAGAGTLLTALARSIRGSPQGTAKRTAAHRPTRVARHPPPAAQRRTATPSPPPPACSLTVKRRSGSSGNHPQPSCCQSVTLSPSPPAAAAAPAALSAAIQSCRRHRPGGRLVLAQAMARPEGADWPGRDAARHADLATLANKGAAPGRRHVGLAGSEAFKLHWRWRGGGGS